ncbi:RIB43A-like with coiled-coils protein 1 isoform X2 [Alligator sinensis]|nr:RIB43A-like with coiled-coils protein 1 isoform X2 [Alligator sinensis]
MAEQRLAWAQKQSMVHAEMQAGLTGLLEPPQTLHQAQVTQHQERQRQEEEEQWWEAEWAAQRQAAAREGLALEELESRIRRGLRRALDCFNRQLAEEQRAQQQHLNRDIYTSMPIVQYHLQFSTSSR